MPVSEFDYPLPPERIAQQPIEPRDAARLLVDRGPGQAPEHRIVRDLPMLLREGDLLVVNSTRVLPARLRLHKRTGGAAEVLLLEPDDGSTLGAGDWTALVRPGRRIPPGTVLEHDSGRVVVEVLEPVDAGSPGVRRVHVKTDSDDLLTLLDAVGEVPLPPYVGRELDDPERYQTVFGHQPGSVAAPTAGLHLTPALLRACRDRGAEVAEVELAIGIGTFRPITTQRVEDHEMHAERYRIPSETSEKVEHARRVVAVGTTVVRALESAAATGRAEGRTSLFIHGDYRFRTVDLLLTNFHMPRSSLLVMVESFVGKRWRDLYDTALKGDYRFLSFGDAMLLTRHDRWPPL